MGIYNSNCDFNKYKIFHAVAESKSFSQAANMLHLSQPAISYAIKELEQTLNTKLFIRERQGIKLTDAGKKLMYYTQKALSNLIMAEKILTEREQEVTGLVRIGIYSHISLFMLPTILKDFTKLHPQATFSIYQSTTCEMIDKLKHRELDFIIMQYPIFLSNNNFNEDILCELDNCFFGTKEMYDTYYNQYDSTYPLILPFQGYADIDSLEEKLKRNNIKFTDHFRCYATEITIKLVKQNLGIGWGLKKSIEKELKTKELYEIPINFEPPKSIYSIAYEKNMLNQTSLAFLQYLKKNINKVINLK